MEELPFVSAIDDQQRQQLHKLLGEMLINITNKVFQGRSLYIDGYRFINCSFINCKLYAYRGTFEFHRCFEESTTQVFNMEALKSVQLYCKHNPSLAVSDAFKPVFHEDGTFSIGQGASF